MSPVVALEIVGNALLAREQQPARRKSRLTSSGTFINQKMWFHKKSLHRRKALKGATLNAWMSTHPLLSSATPLGSGAHRGCAGMHIFLREACSEVTFWAFTNERSFHRPSRVAHSLTSATQHQLASKLWKLKSAIVTQMSDSIFLTHVCASNCRWVRYSVKLHYFVGPRCIRPHNIILVWRGGERERENIYGAKVGQILTECVTITEGLLKGILGLFLHSYPTPTEKIPFSTTLVHIRIRSPSRSRHVEAWRLLRSHKKRGRGTFFLEMRETTSSFPPPFSAKMRMFFLSFPSPRGAFPRIRTGCKRLRRASIFSALWDGVTKERVW